MASKRKSQLELRRDVIEGMVARTVANASDFQDEVGEVTGILLDLNRLSAAVLQTESSISAESIVESLLHRIGRLVSRQPRAKDYATETINAINVLASLGVSCSTLPPSKKRRGEANVEYFLRKGARGLRLVESRGTLKDFFVTQDDFNHAVEALACTARPRADFDVIHDMFLNLGGSETGSAYPLRVVLRFLRSKNLVFGARGTYSVGDLKPKAFRAKAKAAWNGLTEG